MLNDLAALYAANPALFAGSVFVLGLIIGSFLNVVIYRLPIMLEREWRAQAAEFCPRPTTAAATPRRQAPPERFTLSTPRSACPDLQGADQGLAEHPGDQLAAAARPLRLLQGHNLRALSRWWNWRPASCRPGSPGTSASAPPRPARCWSLGP